MKKLLLPLFTIHCTLFAVHCEAQNQHLVDSLTTKLKQLELERKELRHDNASMYDTSAANILYKLSTTYWGNNPDKSLDYANQCLALSVQIGYKKGMGLAYTSMGAINQDKENYLSALEFYKKALKIFDENLDKDGSASSYTYIGSCYGRLADFYQALENELKSLEINEKLGKQVSIASNYGAIGNVYIGLKDYKKALEYKQKALSINKELGNKAGMSANYNGIGMTYVSMNDYAKALEYYQKALSINEQIGWNKGIDRNLNNIAGIYVNLADYSKALEYYQKALTIAEKIKDKILIGNIYNDIGGVYFKQGKFNDALKYERKGLVLVQKIGAKDKTVNSYSCLTLIDSAMGNYKGALEDYKLYIIYRDSITNTENTKKTVALQMNYDFSKIQTADSLKNYQEKEISNLKLQKQKAITYGGFAGIAITIVLLFFVYRNYKKQQHANLQLKEAQEQLIKAEKMAAFGTMASRLSHEILNPLNFVNNFSVLSKDLVTEINTTNNEEDRKEASALLTDNLEKITEHGKRAVDIVKQLQEMSNKGTAQEFFEENKK